MLGSSFGDFALRRVWNHRTHCSRMSSTSLRRTPFSSSTYAKLQCRFLSRFIVEAGLVAFSCAFIEFADEVPKEAQHGSLAHLPKVCSSHLHGLSKIAAVGFCVWCLLTPSLCCHAAFIPASTPGPAHQPCASSGCLEGGTNSAAVESMTSTMLVSRCHRALVVVRQSSRS